MKRSRRSKRTSRKGSRRTSRGTIRVVYNVTVGGRVVRKFTSKAKAESFAKKRILKTHRAATVRAKIWRRRPLRTGGGWGKPRMASSYSTWTYAELMRLRDRNRGSKRTSRRPR